MKCELLCQDGQTPAEPCWNKRVLANYARQITGKEVALAKKCPEALIETGRIACDGVAINEWGYGSVCFAEIEPTRITTSGHDADLPGDLPELVNPIPASQIPGFNFFKPDGGPWDQRMGQGKTPS